MGVPKENRPMRGGKVMTPEEQQSFMSENEIGTSNATGQSSGAPTNASSGGGNIDIYAEQRQQLEQFRVDTEAMNMRDLISLQNQMNAEVQIIKTEEEEKRKILNNTLLAKKALAEKDKEIQLGVLSFAQQMTAAFGKESKAAFFILKALRIAEILVNSFAADMNIQAVWAWNPAVSAALIANNHALAALSIAGVIGTAIAGFAKGTDTVPSMLSPGEMVVPRTFADAIRAGDLTLGNTKSETNNSNVNVTVNAVIEHPVDIKEIAEQIAFETDRELRYIR
jgi:hypothetical protein